LHTCTRMRPSDELSKNWYRPQAWIMSEVQNDLIATSSNDSLHKTTSDTQSVYEQPCFFSQISPPPPCPNNFFLISLPVKQVAHVGMWSCSKFYRQTHSNRLYHLGCTFQCFSVRKNVHHPQTKPSYSAMKKLFLFHFIPHKLMWSKFHSGHKT
jgi:hypothetical protein